MPKLLPGGLIQQQEQANRVQYDEDTELNNSSTSTNVALLSKESSAVVMAELVAVHGGREAADGAEGGPGSGGDGTTIAMTNNCRHHHARTRKATSSCSYYLRRYRCLIFVLIALVEFGFLIAGITFYFVGAGVLTATCEQNNDSRQGKCQLVPHILTVFLLVYSPCNLI